MRVSLPPKPWINNYERQADEAFNRATSMTDDQLRQIRPPLPQIQYLPPRFGYPDYIDRQWTVLQVFGITRLPPGSMPRGGAPKMERTNQDRVDYSGQQAVSQGSDRNTGYSPLSSGSF